MKIFQYISLALEIGSTIETIIALVKTEQPLSGAQIQTAIQPALSGVESTFSVSVPDAVVTEICDAAAAAINKFGSK